MDDEHVDWKRPLATPSPIADAQNSNLCESTARPRQKSREPARLRTARDVPIRRFCRFTRGRLRRLLYHTCCGVHSFYSHKKLYPLGHYRY